jgi:hypothetical protein
MSSIFAPIGIASRSRRRAVPAASRFSLLPPNDTPGLLSEIATDYPDLYCLTELPRR